MESIQSTAGKVIAIAPLGRYLLNKVLGLGLMALLTAGLVAWVYSLMLGQLTILHPLVLLLIAGAAYVALSLVSERRAAVFENGIAPSILPITERFTAKSPILTIENIAEVRAIFTGTAPKGLVFENNDGRRYIVFRSDVGEAVFQAFQAFRRRFYSNPPRDAK